MPVGLFLTTHYFTKTATYSTWKGQMDYGKQVSRKAYLTFGSGELTAKNQRQHFKCKKTGLTHTCIPKMTCHLARFIITKTLIIFSPRNIFVNYKTVWSWKFSEKMVCQQHSKSCFTQLLWINIYNFPWNEKQVHLKMDFK